MLEDMVSQFGCTANVVGESDSNLATATKDTKITI
jgi:hypothetical protein